MIDCLILGDSIAVGVGQARPACQTVARTGITSGAWLQSLLPGSPRNATNVVISLGVNDDPSMATLDNLRRLRAAVQAATVTWLLPGLKEDIRQAIRTVAQQHGDRLIDTKAEAGPDHLHPTGQGYRLIASWTQNGAQPTPPDHTRYAVALPRLVPMVAPARTSGLPLIHTPTNPYGSWPPSNSFPFAAFPPRDYAYRAVPILIKPY